MNSYKNNDIYGDSIEFYDVTSLSHPYATKNILRKFIDMTNMNDGIILDIGAGTGKTTVKVGRMAPNKEVVALEPSKYMRIAFMSRLMECEELRKQITVLPLSAEQYEFEEEISGILCMGILGHLKTEERQCLWEKLDSSLRQNVPVLIELLDPKFITFDRGSRIAVEFQGRLRYETYISDLKQIEQNQWQWLLSYKVFYGGKLINVIESPMCWTYQSAESVLGELGYWNFRGVKLSDTLILARKI